MHRKLCFEFECSVVKEGVPMFEFGQVNSENSDRIGIIEEKGY